MTKYLEVDVLTTHERQDVRQVMKVYTSQVWIECLGNGEVITSQG